MSSLTKKQYNASIGEDDYPVLFGGISEINDNIISAMGVKSNTHGQLKIYGEYLTWRYVPLTKTLYWWFKPNLSQKKQVIDYIQQKYKFSVNHNAMIEGAAMITNHARSWTPHADGEPLPSFKEWYKAHQGD